MATLKYDEKFPAMVEELAAKGEPDARIASRLGIALSTFYNYKEQFPEFAEALLVGRKLCYSRVRTRLLQVAQGHCYTTTEIYKNGELYKTTRRWLPPNLKAIIYFQKNMRIGEVTIKEEPPVEEDSKISKSGMEHMGLMENEKCSVEDGSKISKSGIETESAPVESGSKISKSGMEHMGLMENEKCSVEDGSKISSPLRPSSPFSPLQLKNNPAQQVSKMSNPEQHLY